MIVYPVYYNLLQNKMHIFYKKMEKSHLIYRRHTVKRPPEGNVNKPRGIVCIFAGGENRSTPMSRTTGILIYTRPQSCRLRPGVNGISHGLKTVHRTVFTPVCALVPPFRFPWRPIRKPPRRVVFLLVEPRGIVCIFAGDENRGFARAEPREQHPTGVLHWIIRFPPNQK